MRMLENHSKYSRFPSATICLISTNGNAFSFPFDSIKDFYHIKREVLMRKWFSWWDPNSLEFHNCSGDVSFVTASVLAVKKRLYVENETLSPGAINLIRKNNMNERRISHLKRKLIKFPGDILTRKRRLS